VAREVCAQRVPFPSFVSFFSVRTLVPRESDFFPFSCFPLSHFLPAHFYPHRPFFSLDADCSLSLRVPLPTSRCFFFFFFPRITPLIQTCGSFSPSARTDGISRDPFFFSLFFFSPVPLFFFTECQRSHPTYEHREVLVPLNPVRPLLPDSLLSPRRLFPPLRKVCLPGPNMLLMGLSLPPAALIRIPSPPHLVSFFVNRFFSPCGIASCWLRSFLKGPPETTFLCPDFSILSFHPLRTCPFSISVLLPGHAPPLRASFGASVYVFFVVFANPGLRPFFSSQSGSHSQALAIDAFPPFFVKNPFFSPLPSPHPVLATSFLRNRLPVSLFNRLDPSFLLRPADTLFSADFLKDPHFPDSFF